MLSFPSWGPSPRQTYNSTRARKRTQRDQLGIPNTLAFKSVNQLARQLIERDCVLNITDSMYRSVGVPPARGGSGGGRFSGPLDHDVQSLGGVHDTHQSIVERVAAGTGQESAEDVGVHEPNPTAGSEPHCPVNPVPAPHRDVDLMPLHSMRIDVPLVLADVEVVLSCLAPCRLVCIPVFVVDLHGGTALARHDHLVPALTLVVRLNDDAHDFLSVGVLGVLPTLLQ